MSTLWIKDFAEFFHVSVVIILHLYHVAKGWAE
jgi:hypothetical protein